MPPRFTQIDATDGAYKVIDHEHALIHKGILFSLCQSNPAIANNGEILYQFKTPADGTVDIHLKDLKVWLVDNPWEIELIEAPTVTDGTSQLTPINRNRKSSNTSQLTVYSDPTNISGGTVLGSCLAGGGSGIGQADSGGVDGFTLEYELMPSTDYVLRVKNTSGTVNPGSVQVFWYEAED